MSALSRILTRLAEIQRLQSDLESERSELLVAKKVIERLGDDAPTIMRLSASANRTNRDFILEALAEAGRWLTANEIQELASAIKGSEIPMTSISPGLTELKREGVIARSGFKVALASRAAELGEPTGESAPSLIPSDGDQTGAA